MYSAYHPMPIFSIIVILTSLAGFLLSLYIFRKKRTREQMLCPMGLDCDAVIYSEYSKFFGIPLEIIGLLYYGAVAIFYFIFFTFPQYALPDIIFAILAVSAAAFLFSLYLTFIQAVALKQWCTWCLISASFCTIIFSFALLGSKLGFIPLLQENYQYLIMFHLLGAAIGVGSATVADILFIKFIKDFRISEMEASVLKTISQVIWLALAVIVLSGIGLFLSHAEDLLDNAKFLVKMIVVAVIIANGAFLNLVVTPKLVEMSFKEGMGLGLDKFRFERRAAFAMGAVSLTSWYATFILGVARGISINFFSLLGLYAGLLVAAVIISQIIERRISAIKDVREK